MTSCNCCCCLLLLTAAAPLTAASGRRQYLPGAAKLGCWMPPLRSLLLAVTADCREAFWEQTNKLNLAAIRTSTLKKNNNWMSIPTGKAWKQVSSNWLAPMPCRTQIFLILMSLTRKIFLRIEQSSKIWQCSDWYRHIRIIKTICLDCYFLNLSEPIRHVSKAIKGLLSSILNN